MLRLTKVAGAPFTTCLTKHQAKLCPRASVRPLTMKNVKQIFRLTKKGSSTSNKETQKLHDSGDTLDCSGDIFPVDERKSCSASETQGSEQRRNYARTASQRKLKKRENLKSYRSHFEEQGSMGSMDFAIAPTNVSSSSLF